MKRLWILILSIILFITGCNKSNKNYTEISFSTWGSRSEIATIKKLISSFETQNPSIKVKLIHIPDNYFQKLHLLFASNLTPDVIFINNLNARIYIKAGKLEPLNKYFQNNENLFLKKSLVPLSHNGNIYAIPRDISNMVVYYNADTFDKYGIAYPTNNWSFNDFLKTAQQLTKDFDNDGNPDIFGFGFEKNSIFWLPFLLSNGGGIISNDEKSIILNTTKSIEAIQFYADLRNRYHVAPKASEQSSLTTSQLFLQGKVAMHLCGRWCALTYKNNAKFHWNIATFPKGKNGSIVGLDASGWAISHSSKYKNEAWKLIEYLSSDKSSELFTQDGLIFPANKNIANSKIFQTPPPQNSDAYIKTFNTSQTTPISPKYAEINDIINEAFDPLFNGNKKAQDVINAELINKLEQKLN